MKTKDAFLKELQVGREKNIIHLEDKIKKEYYPSDDDLAWKLYVAFPGIFTEEERSKILKFLTSHITQLICFGFRSEKSDEIIIDIVKINLKESFNVHLSDKSISCFIRTLMKLDKWNE